MTDCYRILGVDRNASPEAIRAAYLARMKVCHPDASRGEAAEEAAEISQAYWQLRDVHRRAEHDRIVFGPPASLRRAPRTRRAGKTKAVRKVSLAKAPARRREPVRPTVPIGAKSSRRRPRGKRLDPLRAAAGIAACSIAVAGFALAGTHFGPTAAPEAKASAVAPPGAIKSAREPVRRRIDAALAESAADEFRVIVAESGVAGAHLYARQCMMELTARPTMTMLDYCLAFDDEASAWEELPEVGKQEPRRYFAADQRFGRYASAAREIEPGPVRESMMADVSFFAQKRD